MSDIEKNNRDYEKSFRHIIYYSYFNYWICNLEYGIQCSGRVKDGISQKKTINLF